jgi:Protein of unknown function (DUF2442)
MKSALRGKTISAVEVGKVSRDGFWLRVDARDLFVPFKQFPWFADASIRQITAVERPSPHHLRWPDLDVDLAAQSPEEKGQRCRYEDHDETLRQDESRVRISDDRSGELPRRWGSRVRIWSLSSRPYRTWGSADANLNQNSGT